MKAVKSNLLPALMMKDLEYPVRYKMYSYHVACGLHRVSFLLYKLTLVQEGLLTTALKDKNQAETSTKLSYHKHPKIRCMTSHSKDCGF
jgi:hypothetical protein